MKVEKVNKDGNKKSHESTSTSGLFKSPTNIHALKELRQSEKHLCIQASIQRN